MLFDSRFFIRTTFCMTLLAASLNAHLVEIQKVIPTIVLDMRYATDNNFTGKKVYPTADCFLEEKAVAALQRVQEKLQPLGLRIKVWDAYRPLSVQRIFWALVPDERYVANPAKGSKHNRGCAVDITLVDKTGNELAMGTAFDDFSERAHVGCPSITAEEQKNRLTLQHAMEEEGFTGNPTEWWHFDFEGWQNYAVQDTSFEELRAR